MRRIAGVVIASLLFSVFSAGAPRTLRLDYYHTGNAHEEWLSLDCPRRWKRAAVLPV